MYTKDQTMQKGDYVYVIYKSIPKNSGRGVLTINVQLKTGLSTDVITTSWECNLPDSENRGWTNAQLRYEHCNFNMLPILNQLAEIRFTKDSTFEQVKDMLHRNGIEQGLLAEIKDSTGETVYNEFLSQTEIKEGSFIRHDAQKKYTIQPDQQKELLGELEYDSITTINLLMRIDK